MCIFVLYLVSWGMGLGMGLEQEKTSPHNSSVGRARGIAGVVPGFSFVPDGDVDVVSYGHVGVGR